MEALQQTFAVVAVLGLLGGVLWWLRRRGLANFASLPRRKRSGMLESVERLPLSPTHTLHLVRLADRVILIAASAGGCSVIESSSWAALQAAQTLKNTDVRPS